MGKEKTPETVRIYELEDALKRAEQRIMELRAERDRANELVQEMWENVEDHTTVTESYREAFQMQQSDGGGWYFTKGLAEDYEELASEHNKLVKLWNKYVVPRSLPVARSTHHPLNARRCASCANARYHCATSRRVPA
jgi:hypothetical protein